MEVAPGVHQIKFTSPNNPKMWVFGYFVDGGSECAIIDTGWAGPNSFDELLDQIGAAGRSITDIKTIVITHLHPDHFGLAGKIKEESGAKVIFHELEKSFVESRYRSYSKLLDELGSWLLAYGAPEEQMPEFQTASVRTRRFVLETDADSTVVGGELITIGNQVWDVIWTPGHTRGHICLFNRASRAIITGDHVLPGITPNISLHPESSENPLGDYLTSLRKIIDLPVDTVLPGHERAFNGLSKRIRDLEEHHEQRLAAMMATMTAEPKTGYQVAAGITWNIGEFKDFDVWARRAAMMETLAHLEYLRRQGKVEKIVIDDVFHYRLR